MFALRNLGKPSINYRIINILKVCNFCESRKEDIKAHQEKLMARGLPKIKPIQGVSHIVLVASGKGGVGKSTTAVNIAVALKLMYPQKTVGLLDTDVFGPSIPLMMNLHDTPLLTKDNLMEPLVNYGIKCMSMGFLVAENAALIWRGLMVMQAMEKLLRQVYWDSIDYLIVDSPPGTGDTHLTLMQNIPISGVVLVTTPQIAAMQVTKRGASMFKKLKVPIIGVVENMSHVKCPACSNDVHLFGTHSSKVAEEIGTTILGKIPLQQEISHNTDGGVPIVIAEPKSEIAAAYKSISMKIVEFLRKTE